MARTARVKAGNGRGLRMATIGYDFERVVSAPSWQARNTLATTLRELGFRITSEQLALLEGRRGSRRSSLLATRPRRLPVTAILRLEHAGAGAGAGDSDALGSMPATAAPDTAEGATRTRVVCRLQDAWGAVTLFGITVGVDWAFRQVFEEVRSGLDSAMARLDPVAAAAGFPEPRFWNAVGTFGPLETLRRAGSRIQGAAIDRAAGVLDGPSTDPTPLAWRNVDVVRFGAGARAAEMTLAETQAHLAVAVLAQAQPGSAPRETEATIEQLDLDVEAALNAATEAIVEIPLTEPEQRAMELLHEQVRIREALPVRTIHVCTTCRHEQVTNPDLARLMRRSGRMQSMVGVGATMTAATIQPFVLVGSLLKLARLDPDWVCPRCQGLSATEGIVTYCPSCGELRREALLGYCPDCGTDLRRTIEAEPFWYEVTGPHTKVASSDVPDAEALPVGSPTTGPTGGKLCDVCGREFAALWRVVQAAPGGPVERFVCGNPPSCALPTVVEPARV